MKKDYIIWTPAWQASCGVKVLHFLAKELEKNGYNVYLYSPKPHLSEYKYVSEISDNMRKNAIIVYPETVYGNPLNFDTVVRWILYYPGKNGGQKKYNRNEILFTYSDEFYKNANVLFMPHLDENLFYDDNSPKKQNCVFVYKGGKWKDVKEVEGLLEINMSYPETRDELATLLRTTDILYSYDDFSALLDEADCCGCKVKIIKNDGIEDYKSKYYELKELSKVQVENFIKITQEAVRNKDFNFDFNFIKIKYFFCKYIYKFRFYNKKKYNEYSLNLKMYSGKLD